MSNDAFDVVVVGGGIAGLSAANRAAQQGLKVAVLERGDGPQYLCNSRYSGGVLHIAMHNAKDPAEKLLDVINNATNNKADPELARSLANTAGRAIDWLQAEGAKYIRVGNIVWQQHVLAPPRPIVAGLDWKGRRPDVTLRQLVTNLEKRGGKLIQTPAASLMEREGRCVGVEAGDGANRQQITARAVVLADGGFQGNLDLVKRFISPQPDRLTQRNAKTGRGDALLMAEAVGARIVGTDRFYGHLLCRESIDNTLLWPYPTIDSLASSAIVVDRSGRRFMDEGLGGVTMTNVIAAMPDPHGTVTVFDHEMWETTGKAEFTPPNP